MALKFRLKGLAETFLESISCPACGVCGKDDELFSTGLTKVTFEGIVVVAQCKGCGEIFIPATQRFGIMNPLELKKAVEKDVSDSGEPPMLSIQAVKLNVEKLNALRKGDLH
jgi:hypothetical protein